MKASGYAVTVWSSAAVTSKLPLCENEQVYINIIIMLEK